MKHLVTIVTILLFTQMALAQQDENPYDTLWKQVAKLEDEALTKSALELVTTISKKAKKEENSAQIIKSLLYTSKYAMTLEEDAQLKIVNDFRTEIEKAEFPTKNVLESYLANLFWQFFQQNRYQFYNRTKTEVKVDSTDFRTWDLTTLFNEISIHFDASLENEAKLKQTPVSEFDVILHQQSDTKEYRPTLFDLLAHNALAFYKTSENNITRPADKFEISDADFLCDGNAFINKNIDTEDQTSLQAKALCIYQKLLMLHLPSAKPYTLAEINIERLNFIHGNATFENKDQQFLEVLENAVSATKGSLAAGLYQHQIATLLNRQGDSYQPKTNADHRWKKKEALAICNSVIKEMADSRGAEQCRALKSQILQKTLQLTAERHVPIQTTSRFLVNYKNLKGLTLTARPVTQREMSALEKVYEKDKKLAFIKKLSVAKQWEATLKNEDDYQSHSTEIIMPPLENGQYLILAETTDEKNKTFSYSPIQVTDLALAETRTNTTHYFQVINRHNGKPISGARLTLRYRKNYDGPRLSENFVTDKMGNVSIPLSDENWSEVNISISKNKDSAYFKDYYVNRRYDQNSATTSYSCFLFTDRSIYRPGQPLYFKGIAITGEKGISSVLENQKVSVSLSDVNGQVVATKEFVTNDYGSFSGEFILPSTGLTGVFSMQANATGIGLNGYASFSVEEYKRPKFETSFQPVTETYKVNDSVTVKGTAMAYAGSTITDAKVAYRVKRAVYYPRWYYWHYPYNNTAPQEIAHGETTTDASGHYKIDFKALPDTSIDRKNLPTFSYEVTADVTDINGETHSATTFVTVGYHALTANMYIANPLNKDTKENKLSISTNNLNGQFVPAKGIVKMYKLKAPESVNRPRVWAAPDYAGWPKSEFKKLFPHDAFANEHDASTWEKGEMVWQSDFDTAKSTELPLGNTKNWASGKYVLELQTQDKFGQPVKDILQTTLFSENDTTLTDNALFQIKTDKDSYAIGEDVKVTLLSSSKDIHVTVNIEKNHKVIESKSIHLSDNSESFTVPVNANDIGGFAITYSFSVYNYFQAGNLNIRVPYPSAQLEIETMTFRDKLQPGTEETWSFKIKGPKGDKVAAELLANMYDASLDAFRGHYWSFNPLIKPTYYSNRTASAYNCFGTNSFNTYLDNQSYGYTSLYFDSFNWFGLQFGYGGFYGRGLRRNRMMKRESAAAPISMDMDMEDSMPLEEVVVGQASGVEMDKSANLSNEARLQKPKDNQHENNSEQETASDAIKIRKNLQENAFFFPQLKTDKEGNVSFSFTTPEALTKWNVQLLAHTKDLESTIHNLQTVTQKELMVIPNAPRFLREGDEIVMSTKIANLTDKVLSGQAKLELIDAVSGKNISSKLLLSSTSEGEGLGQTDFKVDSLGNTQVSWRLQIPEDVRAVQYTVTAKAGDYSDGEQNLLPVLTNRMLVTETLPMWVRSNQTKTFTLDKLKTTTSTTLKHHKLTLEMTSNPAWYAVQALPYLMEYPYECNEQTFSRYYANTLATHISNTNPRVQEVFNQWANSDALVSNLEKNEELKSLLIQETPWLRDAQSETEQKKRIALLFNLNKMKNEQTNALNKLKQNQKGSGAWPWFNGGPDSRFITQHIITGMGHLKQLDVASSTVAMQSVIQNAIAYLDNEFVKEYNFMKKNASNINDDHLSQTQIHYLYMRSFFKDIKASKRVAEVTAYYKGQAQKYWKNKGLYSRGMLALIMHRMADNTTSNKILRALKENSITSDELGMYWKENTNSWYWYQAPIETQSLLIEAFAEITPNDIATVDNLKIWLLKNKQTNQWKTTKATTEAVYALLLQGSDWLSVTEAVDVLIAGEKIAPAKLEQVKVEAGTGYYKTAWDGPEVKPAMAEVQISKKGKGIAWGALYWQYFEDLDKITPAKTPLKLKKKLFLKRNTDTGEEISEITSKTSLKVGDLVRVRIELRADRDMEFVHMKDMRAAGFEPINVISRYKWQDGLGYYESTKDASTNFFFDYLRKGVYVFEYDLRVNNAGDFSNGITTIQSMYAPEFSSHSEGVRVAVRQTK
ncbi:alpha-2-macroglobulin [Aggregatimonas sangjinii]|uniref:Alpha-2-macroglobulin n=1 Tax=Aggregatimonas sangjinii TaxID=2583587 RepID=A0A5B7SVC3_9FLAO|nr:MG2 domain-containing protein [Aggregatimonas sangjinii]QCX01103.1 alpha-2-macroglobulin [Aggregatimonas sangjinii]